MREIFKIALKNSKFPEFFKSNVVGRHRGVNVDLNASFWTKNHQRGSFFWNFHQRGCFFFNFHLGGQFFFKISPPKIKKFQILLNSPPSWRQRQPKSKFLDFFPGPFFTIFTSGVSFLYQNFPKKNQKFQILLNSPTSWRQRQPKGKFLKKNHHFLKFSPRGVNFLQFSPRGVHFFRNFHLRVSFLYQNFPKKIKNFNFCWIIKSCSPPSWRQRQPKPKFFEKKVTFSQVGVHFFYLRGEGGSVFF